MSFVIIRSVRQKHLTNNIVRDEHGNFVCFSTPAHREDVVTFHALPDNAPPQDGDLASLVAWLYNGMTKNDKSALLKKLCAEQLEGQG